MNMLLGKDPELAGVSLQVQTRRRKERTMKRLLLPVMAVGLVALVIGGASAGARQGSNAHAAKAAVIQLKKVGKLGKVLVNGHGQTLYLFEKDKHGKSACSGECASQWPPAFTTGKPKAGSGVNASLLGTTKRKGGKTQVTYNGHPLYAYFGDSKAGQANGEGSKAFGAEWYVLNAKGKKVDKS
jgi:predicted lipoprotein with Yx(FWY)xxD motif